MWAQCNLVQRKLIKLLYFDYELRTIRSATCFKGIILCCIFQFFIVRCFEMVMVRMYYSRISVDYAVCGVPNSLVPLPPTNKQLLFLSPLLLNWLGVVLGWITFKWKWILHIEMYIYRYTYKTDKHIGTLADRLTFCLLIWLTEWLGDRLNHQFTNLTTSSSVTTTLPNHFERSLNVLPIHCLSPSGLCFFSRSV